MKTWIRLALTTIALQCSVTAALPADWVAVRETRLVVAPGSPLDFSALLPNPPIDAGHRLIVGDGGHIATVGTPAKPVPLLCASMSVGPASGGFPDHAEADLYAKQLAMHGYNIARLHFTDANLMFGRAKDFDFDPQTLDRIQYLMAALKKNGIHWMADGLTSWRGAYGGHDDRWEPSEGLKLEVNYEEKSFAHWQKLIEKFLGRVNPYTGIAPLRDDALALVVLVNENSMGFETIVHATPEKPFPDDLRRRFNGWLHKRYGSTAALKKAWPDLKPNEKLENASIGLPADRYAPSPRLRDLQEYFVETERKIAGRMTSFLRKAGYRGMVSDFNNWPTMQASLSRGSLQTIAMNTYQDEVLSSAPGTAIKGTSSIADDGSYMRVAAGTRWLDRPFTITEYDHLFWNRYRYESGLLMPAYAAFQGWDTLCRHAAGPILLEYGEPFPQKRAMLPYTIALDPVARAGETLAALLFRRGDVSPARNTIPFQVRGTADLTDDLQAMEPDALTKLALVSGIGLKASSDGLRVPLSVGAPRDPKDAEQLIAALKQAGLLPRNNRTDLARGIFESDTGEIRLDRDARMLTVSTPRTQAAAFDRLADTIDLGDVKISAATGSGLFAASVLDGAASLADSRRILLIVASDARNTDMRFRDSEEKVIEDFGQLPVLIRRQQMDVALPGRNAKWRLSPVGLDGVVHDPVAGAEGPIAFRLSNTPPSGPTTFFLLQIE